MKPEQAKEIARNSLAKYGFEKEAHMVELTTHEIMNVVRTLNEAGFMVVPKEPTEEMCVAGGNAQTRSIGSWGEPEVCYRAMLAVLTQETKS